jgi:hypothetical protein
VRRQQAYQQLGAAFPMDFDIVVRDVQLADAKLDQRLPISA